MYVICTDGHETFHSRIITDTQELTQLNEQAAQATGGNVWWEAATLENSRTPKAPNYRHIPSSI